MALLIKEYHGPDHGIMLNGYNPILGKTRLPGKTNILTSFYVGWEENKTKRGQYFCLSQV